jgi:N-hydroxyarylamine O-acetyltransferase
MGNDVYSELHKPIPDLGLYFERIGLERPGNCDLGALDIIIAAHQYNVPFENLDIYDRHLPISTAVGNVFEKIVTRKRGGYCFELNVLFYSALLACGYDAVPCLARVVSGNGEHINPALHRQTIVKIDTERYICDVGFGGIQPGFALKIEDGYTQTGLRQIFRIDNIDKLNNEWQISYFTKDTWMPTITFSDRKTVEEDFIAPNFYSYASENSKFVNSRVVNIRTPNGHKSISDNLFIIDENDIRTETLIEDSEKLIQILASHFGIF